MRKWNLLIVGYSLLLSVTLNTYAKDLQCSNINFYTETKNPLSSMPILNQLPMNTCYAHSAVDMLSYENLRTNHANESVNPNWLAFVHKYNAPFYHWNKDSLDFSVLSWSFNSIQNYGNCNSHSFTQAMRNLKNGNDFSDAEIMAFYETLFDEYQKLPGEDFATFEKAYQNAISSDDFKEKSIQNSLLKTFQFIFDSNSDSKLETLYQYISKYCNANSISNYSVPEYAGDFFNFYSSESIMQIFDGVLESDRMLAIGYCFRLSEKGPGYSALGANARLFKLILNNNKCWAHYSTVVGRRKNTKTNSCEYLVRNTMGEDFWTKKFTCFCEDRKTHEKRDCHASEHNPNLKVLGCWISGDDLSNNIFDYTYFK